MKSNDLLAVVVVVMISSCAHRWSCELPPTHPDPKGVYGRLSSVVIPAVEFRDLPIADAMSALGELVREHSANGAGVSFTLLLPERRSVSVPRVSISGTSLTYLEVVDQMCRQAGLRWRIEPTRIVIAPRDRFKEVEQIKTFCRASPTSRGK